MLKRTGTVSALQQQYEGKVNIVMVNVGDDATRPYLSKYKVYGTPTFVLFDARGQVAKSFVGWPGSQTVASYFDQILAQ